MSDSINNKVFIYGVPGSGKTHTSQKMAQDLDLPLFEADTLKEELRKYTTKEERPFLFFGTCQAYRVFGELSPENAVSGLKAVREALGEKISQELDKHNKILMEGAFLDPNQLKNKGKMFLNITTDEEQHKNQFFEHRESNQLNLEEFESTRMVQDFLIDEARKLEIEIIENKYANPRN